MDTTTKRTQEVIVSGKGESKVTAFSSALNDIQKTILKGSKEVLLRIEPKAVTVLSAEEQKYTERFLFFFFPRERKEYQVKLKVEVEITNIMVEEIAFEEITKNEFKTFPLPFLSKKND